MGDGVGDDETDLPFSKDPLWDVGMSFFYNDEIDMLRVSLQAAF